MKAGQDIGKDVIVLTDWMAGRLIRQGYVQKLDDATIPNTKNILPALADVSFDPGRQYSLTWQSGYRRARLQQAAAEDARSAPSTTSGGRSSRAGSRCCRSGATRWA